MIKIEWKFILDKNEPTTDRTNEEQINSRCRTLKTENANYLISK